MSVTTRVKVTGTTNRRNQHVVNMSGLEEPLFPQFTVPLSKKQRRQEAFLGFLAHRGGISEDHEGEANALIERRRRKLCLTSWVRDLKCLSLRAYVDIHLQPAVSAQQFEIAAKKLSGVVSIATLTGPLDLRVRVACHDQNELGQLIALLRAPAGAQETNTAVILREIETEFVTGVT